MNFSHVRTTPNAKSVHEILKFVSTKCRCSPTVRLAAQGQREAVPLTYRKIFPALQPSKARLKKKSYLKIRSEMIISGRKIDYAQKNALAMRSKPKTLKIPALFEKPPTSSKTNNDLQ